MTTTETLHTTKSASYFLMQRGVQGTVNTLNFWRMTGTGPKYRKVQGRVYYAESDLLLFLEGSQNTPVLAPTTPTRSDTAY